MLEARDREGVQRANAAGRIQSLHRAVAILQAVVHSRNGIGLADLSKEVGLHSSTTFHLVKTLVTLGIIRQEPEGKKYRVGTRLFSLAAGALDELELRNIAMPVLTALAKETGESSHLAVLAGRDIFIIGHCDGTASIRLAERVGTARPPHATAIGKVLLSGLQPKQLDVFVSTLTLNRITSKTIVDPEVLKAEIDNVRRNGIAFDDGELSPDLRCLAAPVFDFRRQMIAAMGISSPLWRMGLDRVGSASETVINAARSLSALLGYSEGVQEDASKVQERDSSSRKQDPK